MKRYQNLFLLTGVVVLTVFPLWMVRKPPPGPDGKGVEIFAGADDRAKSAISTIDPSYKPWVKPLMEPPSGEVETCLFALQAALGAGFIGYWYGCATTRVRMQREGDETS